MSRSSNDRTDNPTGSYYLAGDITVPKDTCLFAGGTPFLASKRLIYGNYYKGSGKAYGSGDTTWEPYRPTAKKVSAITSGNCPKLSSRYWTYASKYKRLVLKNNKEI